MKDNSMFTVNVFGHSESFYCTIYLLLWFLAGCCREETARLGSPARCQAASHLRLG